MTVANISEDAALSLINAVFKGGKPFDPEYTATSSFFQALGMITAFTGESDFSNISDQSLAISSVKHKTFVEVTEEGAKAAAVTSVEFVTSIPDDPSFVTDKPFLFFIRKKGTGVILFAGKMGSIEKF